MWGLFGYICNIERRDASDDVPAMNDPDHAALPPALFLGACASSPMIRRISARVSILLNSSAIDDAACDRPDGRARFERLRPTPGASARSMLDRANRAWNIPKRVKQNKTGLLRSVPHAAFYRGRTPSEVGQPAVDNNLCAGHEGRVFAREEQRCFRDLAGLAKSMQWYLRFDTGRDLC